MLRTRFAPSPTGLLHLGNVYSALQCEAWAKENRAELLLRIEDIDYMRCKAEFTQQIMDDLTWLGIAFDEEPSFQSSRLALYKNALDTLIDKGVLYPCFCTRKDIQETTIRHGSLDNYPKTCLTLSSEDIRILKQSKPFSWRLNTHAVQSMLGDSQYWLNGCQEKVLFQVSEIGDVIIGRKDIQYSYHLAVVVDDAAQGITHVIRGEDLKSSTPAHRILQQLLGYDSPLYIHHGLLMQTTDEKLSKSKQAFALKALREHGLTLIEVRSNRLKNLTPP